MLLKLVKPESLHCRTNFCHYEIECFQHLSQVVTSEVHNQMRESKCFVRTVLIDDRLSGTLDGFRTQWQAQR